MTGEQLVIVLRLEPGRALTDALRQDLIERNRRLPDFKRIHGYVLWNDDFPRTASLKIKRPVLASELRQQLDRTALVEL